MKFSTTPTDWARAADLPRAAVFSDRARASVAAETLGHGTSETGGLLLGHRCGPVWYVVESVDPGPRAVHTAVRFVYDRDYLTHLSNKLRWYYRKPLDLLGLWHRHPGSLDRFSAPDRETNRRFLGEYPQGILSALVNIDPVMRMTLVFVAAEGERRIPVSFGDGLFSPALLAYRSAGAPATAARWLAQALLFCAPAAPAAESALEELLMLSESDFAFLTPLCGKLTLKAGEGGLTLSEDGRPLLCLSGGAGGARLTLGENTYSYRPALLADAVADCAVRAGEAMMRCEL